MGNNLFVGSLPYSLGENQLRELFARFGTVVKVKILTEKGSGRSRGIGFVLMSTDAEAERAKKELNESEVGGRKIFVVDAKPAEQQGQQDQAPRPAPNVYTGPERRSGKDRRQNPPAAPSFSGEGRPFQKKPWGKKPWEKRGKPGFGEKRPWSKEGKPGFGGKKPWNKEGKPGFGEKKPWEKRPGGGGFGEKPFWKKKSGPGEFGKKPWEKKAGPGEHGEKPFWKKKAGPGGKGFSERKKWGAGGPNSGRQPGDYKSRPGGFRRKPGGGFRG